IDNPLYKAASPEFDYSQEDLAQYPVLRRLFELRYKFAIEDISRALPGGRHITYGMCYTITPRILAAIGGLKPQKQYEDTQVTNDLKELLLYSVSDSANNPYYRVNPVAPLNVTDGHVVYVGVDREISDIRRGRGPFTRWTNSSYHVEVTARDRDDIRVGEQQFAELGVLNEDNMAVALNNSDPFLFRQVDIMSSRSSSTFEYFHRFYRFLKREGIEIIDADIVVMDSAKQENLAAGQYLEKYGETGEYNIKRIKKVRFTKTQHP
ncbi:hypothetical protein KC685_05165, partial [Candidatus Dojkabacteria bacterium]|nr:hypothetical protein [Candidatus Dojkabacteria bacterium]